MNVRKKSVKGMLFAAALAVTATVPQLTANAETLSGADDWKVEFTADEQMSSNFSSGATSDTLESLQPGDTAEFQVQLSNTNSAETDWYMTNEVVQSLEDAVTTASGGAYSYLLTYTDAAGTTTTIYDSETVGGEDYQSKKGLYEATDALEDYFYLDTLSANQSGTVRLVVGLDGETQGNGYQDTLAKLQLNFAVELPTVTEEHKTVYTEEERTITHYLTKIWEDKIPLSRLVKTGDTTVLVPLLISAAVLGILLLLVAIYGLKLRGKLKNESGMIAGVVIAGALALTLAPTEAQAADSYTYHVRVLAGAQGTFSADGGTADVVEMDVAPGYVLNLSEIQALVSVNDGSKYYVKGIRESGKDNEELVNQSYTVTEDVDLVVAYGMKAGDVAYTVQYLNAETGEELYPSQTYYGNVGDKPVVAYQYVENYVPQAYNLKKTLVEDSSKNIFTFQYTYNPNGGYRYYETDGGVRYTETDGGTVIEYLPGTYTVTDYGVTVMNGDGNGTGAGANGNNAANGDTTITDEDSAQSNTPQEIIDLDDEDTPLASGLGLDNTITLETGARILTAIMALASLAIIVVFGTFLIIENRRKKEKK